MKKSVSNLFRLSKLRKLLLEHNDISSEVKIGKGTSIKGSVINGPILIGRNCRINYVNVMGSVSIGNNTSIWGPNIYIRAALNEINIGNFCSIARNVTIQEYNHDYKNFSTYFIEQNLFKNGSYHQEIISKGGIEIGHDVWIGVNSVILSGVKIGTGAIIGASSVVSSDIPPYAIATGIPAKILKYRFDENIRTQLIETAWWNWDEETIKNNSSKLKAIVTNAG